MADSTHQTLEAIRQAWKNVLPASCACQSSIVQDFAAELTPDEQETSAKFSANRLAEFSTSRKLAHEMITGVSKPTIGVDSEGAPVWPENWCGSITHCKNVCSVVLAPSDLIWSIGIDIEKLGRLSERAEKRVLNEIETNTLKNWAMAHNFPSEHVGTLAFSIKEAFFKYQFPHTRLWLGFADVLLSVEQGRIELKLKSEPGVVQPCHIVHARSEDYLLSAVYQERRGQDLDPSSGSNH